MLYGIDLDTYEKTYIEDALITNKHYKCPLCNEPLIIKNGSIKVPHFAHKSLKNCDPWYDIDNSMSEWHKEWQNLFPKEYREVIITNSKGEKHIADISYNDYIIEFQHSPMSADEFHNRTLFYTRLNKKLIWVFDFIDECQTEYEKGYDFNYDEYEYKLYEYEDNKWKWLYPKKTFNYFNSGFKYWKDRVYLMFEDDKNLIHRIVWNIQEWNNLKEKYDNNYKRFCTKGNWTINEFLLNVQNNMY